MDVEGHHGRRSSAADRLRRIYLDPTSPREHLDLDERSEYFRTAWCLWDARYRVTIQRTGITTSGSLMDRQEWKFLAFRWRRPGFYGGVWSSQ